MKHLAATSLKHRKTASRGVVSALESKGLGVIRVIAGRDLIGILDEREGARKA